MEIQGSAADLIKLAMLHIHQRLRRDGLTSRMLLQIHDELVFEAPPAELKQLAALVQEEMTTPLEKELGLRTPLKVDLAAGPNWLDVEEMSGEWRVSRVAATENGVRGPHRHVTLATRHRSGRRHRRRQEPGGRSVRPPRRPRDFRRRAGPRRPAGAGHQGTGRPPLGRAAARRQGGDTTSSSRRVVFATPANAARWRRWCIRGSRIASARRSKRPAPTRQCG